MFKINYDFFDNPVVPDYVLSKSNKERIGIIKCANKTITSKFNDLDEVNFTTNLYMDNEKNPIYDGIEEMKYILLPDIGFFAISSVEINSEGTELESKTVNAKSYECLLAQKYLESFVINMGTTESIDSVSFYNLADKSHSLIHLILEKCPDWDIGHIDIVLQTMQRSFEVTRQDVYSFLMEDVATAFECIFIFDTLNNTINIYAENNIGEDTDIYVSYNNLLKTANATLNTDDIKTCLTLIGSDDLSIREVNMGYDRIYNFEYFNTTEYMSENLCTSYNQWKNLRDSKIDAYTSLLSQYQDYYTQINNLTNQKMPSVTGSTDWTEYGLVPLQEQLSAYEQKQSVMMKSGWGDSSSPYYSSSYLPVYNTIQDINAQIQVIEKQLSDLKSQQDNIYSQMQEIIDLVSMENNFTEDELKELCTFIREDELSSDNYVVTDIMTDEERFSMLNDFLAFGEEELAKVAAPQFSFSADMSNLFVIPEFKQFNGYFSPGNYIHVAIRDDYIIKSRLLTMTFDFYDMGNFSVTFGNYVKTSKNIFTDITEAINIAKSAATSVSFNQSYWNQAGKDTSDIGKALSDGLLSQGYYLANGDDSDMLIDSRGIFVNTTSGQYADKDSIFIGGGRILFTDDNWKTVAMAVGRADIKGESRFGVFADFCIASYIAGSEIEASNMTSSTITTSAITSTDFNNGDGTFHVDSRGNLVAASADIKGTVKADSGYIGGENGFTIVAGKIYSGKNSLTSNTNGIYIGTDGIALGANSVFKVDSSGNITATSGTIGGAAIASNSIHSSNGNWYINSDGSTSFKNVFISGVNYGSSFGSIGYNDGITWGDFSGASYFGSTITNPFSGTTVTQIESLAVGQITADRVKAKALEAGFITADTISANYATIGNLNTATARISTIEANYISANTVAATYATIDSLNAVNGKFSSLNADNITAGTLSVNRLDVDAIFGELITRGITVKTLNVQGGLSYKGYIWTTKTINGVTYLVASDA